MQIDYPVKGADRFLTVATMRPETIVADVAVAVNPEDERRYAGKIGKTGAGAIDKSPLEMIIADEAWWTGSLEPVRQGHARHDPNDFEIGQQATGSERLRPSARTAS